MKPFQKLLVATDFSPHAEEATRIAADLARRYAAPLTLIYVNEPINVAWPESLVILTGAQLDQLTAGFEDLLGTAQQNALTAGAEKVDTRMLRGFAAQEIVNFAGEGGFDLIVMGTHGRKGLQRFLVGSVAERVVQTAPCPVLTVPLRKAT